MFSINVYDDQREMKQHGSYEFPAAVYHYVMSDCVMGFINWHWHEEIQLNLVTKGAVRFFADGQQLLVKEGDGFFINSGLDVATFNVEVGDDEDFEDAYDRIYDQYALYYFDEAFMQMNEQADYHGLLSRYLRMHIDDVLEGVED